MRDLRTLPLDDVIILDARPAEEYQAGHITGAISVPIDGCCARLRSLPTDKEYVAYCRGPLRYADRAVDRCGRVAGVPGDCSKATPNGVPQGFRSRRGMRPRGSLVG